MRQMGASSATSHADPSAMLRKWRYSRAVRRADPSTMFAATDTAARRICACRPNRSGVGKCLRFLVDIDDECVGEMKRMQLVRDLGSCTWVSNRLDLSLGLLRRQPLASPAQLSPKSPEPLLIRFSAAACQTDFANPLERGQMAGEYRSHAGDDRCGGRGQRAVPAGSAGRVSGVRACGAGVSRPSRSCASKLAVPIPNEHTERLDREGAASTTSTSRAGRCWRWMRAGRVRCSTPRA